MVILHAHGDSRFGGLRRAAAFAGVAAKVIVPDRRGQGESQPRDSTMGAGEAADVAALLAAIPGGDACDRVLLGVQGGAAVALEAAAVLGERVIGVIVEDPPPRWDAPVRSYMKAWRVPAWLFLPAAAWVVRHVSPGVAIPDAVAAAGDVTCPVLAIYKRDGEVWAREGATAVAEAAERGGERGEVVEVETQGAGYREVVVGFVKEVALNNQTLRSKTRSASA